MFTDIAGYTALSQKNEALALKLLKEHRKVIRPFITKHKGKEIKTIGDAFLVEFASALDAIRCAYEIQQSLHEKNESRVPEKQIAVRIGIHLGDVVHDEKDVYGDAVNVASRIEPLAEAGGISLSEQVYHQIRNKFEFPLVSLGRKNLKNVELPVEVYKIVLPWMNEEREEVNYDKRRIAVLPFANISPDPNDEYLADGLTEELITRLAKMSGLKTIARTSVLPYKNKEMSIEDIARELKVGTIVEGSVRRAGDKLRLTVQLIDSQSSEHLWAETYDRDLKNVFEIQSDIAECVSDNILPKLDPLYVSMWNRTRA